ncbi:hypothetical protein FRZ44_49060 [Hypericibacter terrae]|jgi:hypothetical protein|uniref:Uncharacterized protein n=1 Tax=Hypericibacter terrae TaxID=2602015 RepID=A0A5J6MQW6_9PROT|nr:hypothetical protein [Hypericibacter terrae]QEX19591.1 hypothetical protein FRZ44_49060 [Hypericibacter terrae]
MSLFRTFSPSIAALGLAATVLGVGLSCALAPAWAGTRSCEQEIKSITETANQQSDGTKKDKALSFLAAAQDELVDEGDEEDCMSQVDKAKRVLGL